LLAHLGVTFAVLPSEVDESTSESDPGRAATELALRKADAVAPDHPGAIVIGSDTIVALEGRMLGKPHDADEARSMLRALRGRTHEVVTGVAVVRDDQRIASAELAHVTMRDYTDGELEAWIETGAAFDKAGAYASQDPAFRPAAAIEGCACAVIGLPLWSLRRLLDKSGIEADAPSLERCASCPAREI
jgi:MAF protein